MKRLTIYKDGALEINCENCPETKICKSAELTESDCLYFLTERLAEYEDAEEQGLLVRLPCKIGEPIYHIIDDCELSGDCGTKRMCKGCEYRNLFVEEDVFHLCLLTDKGVLRSGYYATSEAAEKALEEV